MTRQQEGAKPRPSLQQVFMSFATSVSRRSCCTRRQVGCIITSLDGRQVYGIGYNGGHSGGPNGCTGGEGQGQCECLHAEINAIINCDASRSTAKVIYTTTAPCKMCAKAIVNLNGVVAVHYATSYRGNDGIWLLVSAGIDVVETAACPTN